MSLTSFFIHFISSLAKSTQFSSYSLQYNFRIKSFEIKPNKVATGAATFDEELVDSSWRLVQGASLGGAKGVG